MEKYEDKFKGLSIPQIVDAVRKIGYKNNSRIPNEKEVDCTGLAAILVPEFAEHTRESNSFIRKISKELKYISYENMGKSSFTVLKTPENGCLVTMSTNPNAIAPEHIGVFFDYMVIHHTINGVNVDSLNIIKMLYAKVDFIKINKKEEK